LKKGISCISLERKTPNLLRFSLIQNVIYVSAMCQFGISPLQRFFGAISDYCIRYQPMYQAQMQTGWMFE
jgi:hypothetical protein